MSYQLRLNFEDDFKPLESSPLADRVKFPTYGPIKVSPAGFISVGNSAVHLEAKDNTSRIALAERVVKVGRMYMVGLSYKEIVKRVDDITEQEAILYLSKLGFVSEDGKRDYFHKREERTKRHFIPLLGELFYPRPPPKVDKRKPIQ